MDQRIDSNNKERGEIKRKEYYLKNKARMNQLARDRYKRKVQEDPNFYKTCLENNQKAYYRKIKKELTEEEEIEFMNKVIKDIRELREIDEGSERSKNHIAKHFQYNQICDMFFS